MSAKTPREYAIPSQYSLPLDSKAAVYKAVKYFKKSTNREPFGPDEQTAIWRRLVRASRRYGVGISQDILPRAGLQKGIFGVEDVTAYVNEFCKARFVFGEEHDGYPGLFKSTVAYIAAFAKRPPEDIEYLFKACETLAEFAATTNVIVATADVDYATIHGNLVKAYECGADAYGVKEEVVAETEPYVVNTARDRKYDARWLYDDMVRACRDKFIGKKKVDKYELTPEQRLRSIAYDLYVKFSVGDSANEVYQVIKNLDDAKAMVYAVNAVAGREIFKVEEPSLVAEADGYAMASLSGALVVNAETS